MGCYDVFDREGEIGIGEGFVFQGEVPPFAIEGFEAVTQHGSAQQHTIGKLLSRNGAACGTLAVIACVLARFRIATEIGMTFNTKPVKGATHIHFLFSSHVEERQVDGAATGMSTLLHDVILWEKYILTKIGIEIGLH